MGKGLQKSLQLYLSKLRKAMQAELRQHSIPTNAATSWILSACKHPKTPSFTAERHQQPADGGGPAATLADVDRFLFENFNSLYTSGDGDGDADGAAASYEDYLVEGCYPPPGKAVDLPRTSQRFFMSPGTSSSLLEEARPSAASSTSSSYSDSSSDSSQAPVSRPPRPSYTGEMAPAVPGDGVAVMTFSKDPYEDFRRSMEEMVEARHADAREPLDWDFMEELLISYLELNDRCVHKHILGAFTDVAVAFRRRRPPPGGRREIPQPPSASAKGRRKGRQVVAAARGGVDGP